jgi:ATP-dependent DNA helicase RecG
MKKYSDGFKIADEDLKQRGPGDFFGSASTACPI